MSFQNRRSDGENSYSKEYSQALSSVSGELVAKSPMVYLDRLMVSLLLTRIKMFEKIVDVQGSIVECGVHRGNSLMAYYHLSSILEPAAYKREIIGFDSFEGFPSISINDLASTPIGGMKDVNYEQLCEWITLQDKNRSIGHIPKVNLVKGDACQTIPEYVSSNPHLIVAFLFLDFDLYEPTLAALKYLLPLVPKGGLVGFDELADPTWPGETVAFKEVLKLSNIKLKKFYFDAHISYYIVQ